MRNVIYHVAVTLDGYICHRDGSIEGLLLEGDHADDFESAMTHYDTVLMGRNTYEFGFQYGLKAGDVAYPGLRHYIFSGSLSFEASDQVRLVRSNTVEKVRELKAAEGRDIWLCGGGELAGSLLDNDLIDRVILKINPVLFGSGRRLFGLSERSNNLRRTGIKHYENGVILGEYEVVRRP